MSELDFDHYRESVSRQYGPIVELIGKTATKCGLDLATIAEVNLGKETYPVFRMSTPQHKKRKYGVCMSAGVHGDEWEGTIALLEFIKRNPGIINQFQFTTFPLIDLFGFVDYMVPGKGYDLNNQFMRKRSNLNKIVEQNFPDCDLSLDVHKGESLKGFVLFERKRKGLPSLARRALEQLRSQGMKIEKSGRSNQIRDGLIKSKKKEHTLEEFTYRSRRASWSLTLEIPTIKLPFGERVFYGYEGIKSTLTQFWKLRHHCSK